MADKKNKDEELPVGVNPQSVYVGGETLADRLIPHIKKIFAVIGIVGLLIAGFFMWRWYANRQAAKATSALVSALDELDAEIGEGAGTGTDAEPSTSYPTRQARAEAVLGKLRKVKGDPRSGAALLEADLLFQSGQLDAAEAAYRKVAGKKTLEGVVAREGLGYVAEARGDLDKALEAFKAAQPDDAGLRREVTMYHEGRILALQGKKEEARAALDKALAKAKELGSDLESIIEVRLTQLDAPPPAPGTKPAPPVEVPAGEQPPPAKDKETP